LIAPNPGLAKIGNGASLLRLDLASCACLAKMAEHG